jgi:hypothetical protein
MAPLTPPSQACASRLPTANGQGDSATTDASGAYTITGLATGTSQVKFADCAGGTCLTHTTMGSPRRTPTSGTSPGRLGGVDGAPSSVVRCCGRHHVGQPDLPRPKPPSQIGTETMPTGIRRTPRSARARAKFSIFSPGTFRVSASIYVQSRPYGSDWPGAGPLTSREATSSLIPA